jgi:hypothetical protein
MIASQGTEAPAFQRDISEGSLLESEVDHTEHAALIGAGFTPQASQRSA